MVSAGSSIIWPLMSLVSIRSVVLLVSVGASLFASGCVERLLQVRSTPPGAKVYVNGEEVGSTPCDHGFAFYGTVDVTVRRAGSVAQRQLVTLSPPWYQFFPMDLVTDVFIPWTIRDVHEISFELEPSPREIAPETRREMERRADEASKLLSPEETAES